MVTPPPLTDVQPGDPITAQAWNTMLAAVRLLVDNANQRRGTLTVKVLDPGSNPFRGATVTAVSMAAMAKVLRGLNFAGETIEAPPAQPQGPPPPPRAGIFVGGGVNAYRFDQMLPGRYVIMVEADGYTAQPLPTTPALVTVGEDADPPQVTFTLKPTVERFPVPKLLGEPLESALNRIKEHFAAGRIIDSHGVELAPGKIPEQARTLPVLGQFPIAGALEPASSTIFVHVSATSEVLKRVKMPDLRGLTLPEAKAAVEALGLTLGAITTLGRPGEETS